MEHFKLNLNINQDVLSKPKPKY